MTIELIPVAAAIGFLTKYVDLIEDEGLKSFKHANLFFGAGYGLLIGMVIANYTIVAPLFLAVIAATILTGKIDSKGHYSGVAAILLVLLIQGLKAVDWQLFGIFLIAGVADELVNTKPMFKRIGRLLKRIFKLRLILEITTFIVSLTTGVWILWITLLNFDVAYILTNKVLGK